MFIKSVLLKSLYFQLYVTFDIDNFSEELLLYFHDQKNPGLSRLLSYISSSTSRLWSGTARMVVRLGRMFGLTIATEEETKSGLSTQPCDDDDNKCDSKEKYIQYFFGTSNYSLNHWAALLQKHSITNKCTIGKFNSSYPWKGRYMIFSSDAPHFIILILVSYHHCTGTRSWYHTTAGTNDNSSDSSHCRHLVLENAAKNYRWI